MKVMLNPANIEIGSFYDPLTGVNLFLGTPISDELTEDMELDAIIHAINHKVLIVSSGKLPKDTNHFELDPIKIKNRTSLPLDDFVKYINHWNKLKPKDKQEIKKDTNPERTKINGTES
jgi:hypothetical protein